MSAIKLKLVQQTVVASTTQPLKLGGVAVDGSDAVITIEDGGISGVSKSFTLTLPSASWTGASAPYSKVVTLSGILASDRLHIGWVGVGVYATDATMEENWARVYRVTPSTNSLTFYAHSVPSADINLQVEVVR